MRKNFILLTLPVLVPLLLFIGCATDRNAVQRKEVPPMTLSEKGITVTLNYLTDDQLIKRFGEKNNPFVLPPSAFGLNRTFIFELSIESQTEAEIILNKLEMQYSGGAKAPKNIFHFINYWEMELRTGDIPKYNLAKLKLVIKNNLIPNELTVEGGSNHKGLIVFLGRLPRYGNFTVFVPIFNRSGEIIHNFRFGFEL